jgi:hypothetical protein
MLNSRTPLSSAIGLGPWVVLGWIPLAVGCSSPSDGAPSTVATTGGAQSTGASGGTPGAGGTGAVASSGTGAVGASDPGTGGAAASGQATLVEPIDRGNGDFALELRTPDEVITFIASATNGGRISVFGVGGQNLLTGPDINATNWGSTFWPSPQAWAWPPDPAFDSAPYTATIDGTTVVMTSPIATVDPVGTFTVTKRFTPNLDKPSITVEYLLSNSGTAAISAACWEVTRVASGGLSFFPAGDGILTSGLSTTETDGVVWFLALPEAITDAASPKLYADGAEGWLGHVAGDILMVKSFPDVPSAQQARQAVTGRRDEAEIEVYASASYVELEEQGPYSTIGPGQTLSWTVTWHVTRLPQGMISSAGNTELVSLARSLVN